METKILLRIYFIALVILILAASCTKEVPQYNPVKPAPDRIQPHDTVIKRYNPVKS